MTAGVFAFLLVLAPLGFASIPAMVALRTRTLFAADFGLVLLPAPAYLLALLAFNEPAQTGWAGIAYPFVVLWFCVVVFFVRVFAMPRLGLSARSAAICTFIVLVLVAALFGAFVPPLYE